MSEQTDAVQEKELQELGLMYPRVTKEQIDSLMEKVQYHTYVPIGTTTTIATAILPIGISKFTLAMTKSACVDPRNFNAKLGADYAIQDCVNAARDKLWELEGYHLAKTTALEKSTISYGTANLVRKFRKKPIVIEAMQFTLNNINEVEEFVGGDIGKDVEGNIVIATLEGAMKVSLNDWVIKGIKGEFYPCKPDIFQATYEPA